MTIAGAPLASARGTEFGLRPEQRGALRETGAPLAFLISWVEFPEACFGFDLSVQYVFQNAPELAPGFFTVAAVYDRR